MTAQQFDPIWAAAFQNALDEAWPIVMARSSDVELLAKALQARGTLAAHDVATLVKPVNA